MRILANGDVQYYYQDGIGSILKVEDQNGGFVGSRRYDAWGNVISSLGTIPLYGYTGREPDATGLIYYRARYYDPEVGRFIQRDPSGFADGVNLYLYARNNPVTFTDPLGLAAQDPTVQASQEGQSSYFGGASGSTGGQSSGSQSLSQSSSSSNGSSGERFVEDITPEEAERLGEQAESAQIGDAAIFDPTFNCTQFLVCTMRVEEIQNVIPSESVPSDAKIDEIPKNAAATMFNEAIPNPAEVFFELLRIYSVWTLCSALNADACSGAVSPANPVPSREFVDSIVGAE